VMVIGTTPLFVSYSRTVIFDITLTLFTCGAIFAGFLAEESDGRKRRNWYLVAAAAAGFATLVKGPVGFIVPLLVLLVANHGAQPGSIRRLFAPLNFVVFFAVVLPWFIGVSLAHPDFPRYGIVEESFHRFTTGSFRRSKPIYYYPYIIATTFFPWNLLIPGYIAAAWRRRVGWARIDRLCVGWSIVVFIFFSLSSSKMPGYILSLTVSLGILIARMFDRALEAGANDSRRAPLQAAAVLGVVALIGSVVAIYLATDPMQFEQRVRLRVGEPEQFQDFWIPLVVTFLLIALVSAAALVRRSVRISFAALVTFPTAIILFNLGILEFTANRRSARNLSVELSSVAAKAKIACLECLPHGFPFYLGQTVTLFTKDGAELSSNYVLFSLKTGASWPSTLIAVANRDAWLDGQTEAIVLIARTESKPVLDEIAAARNGRVVGLTREYCALLLPARTTG
jgi:4-amino-4-deoxy-L-arabinose transferase-like glycosyltransferase